MGRTSCFRRSAHQSVVSQLPALLADLQKVAERANWTDDELAAHSLAAGACVDQLREISMSMPTKIELEESLKCLEPWYLDPVVGPRARALFFNITNRIAGKTWRDSYAIRDMANQRLQLEIERAAEPGNLLESEFPWEESAKKCDPSWYLYRASDPQNAGPLSIKRADIQSADGPTLARSRAFNRL